MTKVGALDNIDVAIFAKHNKSHVIIASLFLISVALRSIGWNAIYSFYYRGHLLESFASSDAHLANEYSPADSKHSPTKYDIVTTSRNGDLLVENYYSNKGRRTQVVSSNGEVQKIIYVSNTENGIVIGLISIGLLAIIVAFILKMMRAKSFAFWKLPYNRKESILLLYGWAGFAGTIISQIIHAIITDGI